MPLPDQITERVRASKIADLLQHDWIRWGGGLYAGAFLREFTDGRPWAHLDIAGPVVPPRLALRPRHRRRHRLRRHDPGRVRPDAGRREGLSGSRSHALLPPAGRARGSRPPSTSAGAWTHRPAAHRACARAARARGRAGPGPPGRRRPARGPAVLRHPRHRSPSTRSRSPYACSGRAGPSSWSRRRSATTAATPSGCAPGSCSSAATDGPRRHAAAAAGPAGRRRRRGTRRRSGPAGSSTPWRSGGSTRSPARARYWVRPRTTLLDEPVSDLGPVRGAARHRQRDGGPRRSPRGAVPQRRPRPPTSSSSPAASGSASTPRSRSGRPASASRSSVLARRGRARRHARPGAHGAATHRA